VQHYVHLAHDSAFFCVHLIVPLGACNGDLGLLRIAHSVKTGIPLSV